MTAEIEGFSRQAAIDRGIDPDISIRVWRSEGGVDEYAKVGKFDTGWSWWPPQLHYGGPEYPQYGTVAGMGIGFTKLTGWQPGTEAAWRDAIRYALNRAKVSGWGAWYGAAHVGVGQWEGISDSRWDPNREVWDFEGPPIKPTLPEPIRYDPLTPPERQIQDWTCSIRSTAWVLRSLGRPVDIGQLQDEMVPKYVTPALGLLDGRGYGIADVLKAHLPADWDARISVYERTDWEDLVWRAGKGPQALGLHGAYHWIDVAYVNPDGTLQAPNPAPKYPAGYPIGDVLTRDEFDHFGPASCVWVDASGSGFPEIPPTGPDPTDPYAPWFGHVGSGLLQMMDDDHTFPAQHASTWLPLGQHPSDIEECYGKNAVLYIWMLQTSQGFRDRLD